MKSYKAQTNTITIREQHLGEMRTQDQPHITPCVLLHLPHFDTVGLLWSQSVNESPFSPLTTTALLITATGQDPGFWHHREVLTYGSLWKPRKKSSELLKVKDFSPCFIYPSLGSTRWVQRYRFETYPYQITVFTKTHAYTLLCMVGLT